VMTKRSDSAGGWWMQSSTISNSNVVSDYLKAYASAAESTSSLLNLDMLSTGFKLRSDYASRNASGGTYIYAAFAEAPAKYSLAR